MGGNKTEIIDVKFTQDDYSSANELFARLKKKAWLQGVPISGLFELTPRCTLDCEMCYVHLTNNQISHPELQTEQWLSLMEQACAAGMMFATLTGGECLMYPGFRDLYEYLTGRGVLVTVLTNGTLLDEEWAEWFCAHTPQRVQISVYGCTSQGCKRVTGSSSAFEKVDRAIDLLSKYRIPFELAITVSSNLVEDFESILRYCVQKNPRNCMVNACPFDARPETERRFSDYAPTLDQQAEIYKIQSNVLQELFHHDNAMTAPVAKQSKGNQRTPPKGVQCSAGRNSFSITWEGKMLPCSVFDFAAKYPLTEGFAKSWENLHQACLEYINPIECIACDYYKACRFCPAGHFMRMGEGRADPFVCEEAHKMVSEGIRTL